MLGTKPFDLDSFSLNNLAIIASAGTGKTYNICGIVEKLILSGIDLKEILIVTYTEKAAEELKNRIREKLTSADIDNATIGTIHSFCQKTIEEFCIASKKPSKLVLVDESSAAEDFAKQYLRTNDLLVEIAEIKKFESEIGESLDVEKELVKRFCAIANSYYLDKSNNEVPSIICLNSVLNPDVADAFDNIISGKAFNGQVSTAIKEALLVLQKSSNPKLNELYTILDGSITFKFSGTKYRTSKSFTQAELDAYDLIKNTRDELNSRTSIIKYFVFKHAKDFYKKWQEEKTKLSVQTYNDMIRSVREEVVNNGPLLNALKKRYKIAIIDEFQDTNQKQWDIFKNVFLCENHNIIVVLDPKQSIYSFQGSDITVSDNAINEIAASGGEVFSLLKNYRASKDIIESTGNFFKGEKALNEKMNFVPSSCGKPYLGFKYKGNTEIPSYWICTDFDAVDLSDTDETQQSDTVSEQDKYARIVCQTIIDCCTKDKNGNTNLRVVRDSDSTHPTHYEDNVSFRDFTVLARTRTEMPSIKKALEESGIPYMQYKDMSVFTGIECANWIAILDAINASDFSGRNRAKFRKALYTSFFGYSLEEINSSEFDKDNIPEILLFDNWRASAKASEWETLVNGIIIDTGLVDKLNSLKDLKTLGIYKQVGDYCIDYLAKSQSIDSLIINLKKLQRNIDDEESGDSDNSLAAITTDFDCVKLMTIHASKGLEFPIVISFGGFKAPIRDADAYIYHDMGVHKLSFENPDSLGQSIYSQERTEEWQRLFYVAYTRAKYVLVLPNYEKVGDSFIKDSIKEYVEAFPYRNLKDNKKNYSDLKIESAKILNSNKTMAAGIVTEEMQKNTLKDIISNKKNHASYKHAYSSLSHHKSKSVSLTDEKLSVSEAEDTNEETLSGYDVLGKQVDCSYDESISPLVLADDFPAGAGLGNAIHEVFELIDYSSVIRTADNESLINNSYSKEGFGKTCKWLEDTYSIIENVVTAKLPEIHGNNATGKDFSLNELSFKDRKNEVEFNFNKENEKLKNYFNGFIDLIFKRGDYYSILDWKSDRLRDEFSSFSNGKILKKHIDELYSIQRVLYSYCLIKWLKNFYKACSDQEIFEQHFGGVYYICIRGCNEGSGNGIYAQTWESFSDLESAYMKIVKERIGA